MIRGNALTRQILEWDIKPPIDIDVLMSKLSVMYKQWSSVQKPIQDDMISDKRSEGKIYPLPWLVPKCEAPVFDIETTCDT